MAKTYDEQVKAILGDKTLDSWYKKILLKKLDEEFGKTAPAPSAKPAPAPGPTSTTKPDTGSAFLQGLTSGIVGGAAGAVGGMKGVAGVGKPAAQPVTNDSAARNFFAVEHGFEPLSPFAQGLRGANDGNAPRSTPSPAPIPTLALAAKPETGPAFLQGLVSGAVGGFVGGTKGVTAAGKAAQPVMDGNAAQNFFAVEHGFEPLSPLAQGLLGTNDGNAPAPTPPPESPAPAQDGHPEPAFPYSSEVKKLEDTVAFLEGVGATSGAIVSAQSALDRQREYERSFEYSITVKKLEESVASLEASKAPEEAIRQAKQALEKQKEYERKKNEINTNDSVGFKDKNDQLKRLDEQFGKQSPTNVPILGPDGVPDEDGINPKTGKLNIGGYDLTQTDAYILLNFLYAGLTPHQAALLFVKMKQTDGNITIEDLADFGDEKPLESEMDNVRAVTNNMYYMGKMGVLYSDLDWQQRQATLQATLGLFFFMAMGGTGRANPEELLNMEEPAIPEDFKRFNIVGHDWHADDSTTYDQWMADPSKEMPIPDATRLKPNEQYTAGAMMEIDPSLELKEYSRNDDYDYYIGSSVFEPDQVYDQMGSAGASDNWYRTKDEFFEAIDRHVLKSASITVIDLRFFTPEQISEIESYVYNLIVPESSTIWFIRFPD